jgi:hypothetical protein
LKILSEGMPIERFPDKSKRGEPYCQPTFIIRPAAFILCEETTGIRKPLSLPDGLF